MCITWKLFAELPRWEEWAIFLFENYLWSLLLIPVAYDKCQR